MQTNPMVLDAQVDGLYRLVKGRVNWDNLIPTCIEVARELENMTHLRGPERLDLLRQGGLIYQLQLLRERSLVPISNPDRL